MKGSSTLLLSAVLSLAVACDTHPEALSGTVRFLAEECITRTAFGEAEGNLYPVRWTEGEAPVLISLNSLTPVEAGVQAAPDGRSARFEASFQAVAGEAYNFYALSPASAFQGISDGEWAYSVPAVQTPGAESVDPAALVLCARSETTDTWPEEVRLSFSHLTAYGKLSLSGINSDVRAVQLIFGEGDTLTVNTTATRDIWFGLKPRDVSGQTVTLSVRTGSGRYSRSITFPEGRCFEAGKVARFEVDLSGAAFEPDRKSISILAIGNSFSIDAMQYLYGYLRQAGYQDIHLGNLYIGGCTLATHAANLAARSHDYTYYTNSSGSWTNISGKEAAPAIRERAWDYISLQQASGLSGIPDSYEPYLSAIVDSVKAGCPGARLMWHMTWAYQQDSNHSDFSRYGNNQTRMYEAILGAVQTKVLPRGDFDFVIPCATAIQNLRTSFMGDHMTRDGYHMSYQVGRVATALMWLKQISGAPLSGIDIRPSDQTLSETQTAAIKDAVEQAYARPFAVTPSSCTVGNTQPDEAIRAQFAEAGYDLSKYKALPLDLVPYAYYNSTSSNPSTLTSRMAGSSASNINQFAASTGVFSKEDIPAGSVIVMKPNYQYRPEGWTSLSTKNASSARPAQVSAQIVVVDDSWWGKWKYRAFNLSERGNPGLDEARMKALQSSFAIFVPTE